MKLQTQFTVPKKELRDLDYVNKVEVLEKTFKRDCLDYPIKKDCLVCCNWLFINYFSYFINSKNIQNLLIERLNNEIKILPNNNF